jgi:hypothetical protein
LTQPVNALHAATRSLAERGNAPLKTTFKALQRVSLCPWRISAITRRRPRAAPPQTRPHHMINALLGNVQ